MDFLKSFRKNGDCLWRDSSGLEKCWKADAPSCDSRCAKTRILSHTKWLVSSKQLVILFKNWFNKLLAKKTFITLFSAKIFTRKYLFSASCKLPYFVERRRNHLFPLFLHSRRDKLDPKTMDFTYVELVQMRNVCGDVFVSVWSVLLENRCWFNYYFFLDFFVSPQANCLVFTFFFAIFNVALKSRSLASLTWCFQPICIWKISPKFYFF